MSKINTWIFVAAFFIICLIPSVGMLFYKAELAANRTLSEMPQIRTETGTLNTQYFNELQTYVSEHFAYRGELVETDSRIKYELFHTPCDDQVVTGKDGWLFFGETLADYAGVSLTGTEYGIPETYDLSGYTIEESHEPDLYKILFPTARHYEQQRIYDDGATFEYVGRLHSLDDMTIRTSSDDGCGKAVLVYRDSFGRAMIPYMGATFDSAVFNRSTPYNLSLVEQTECDYVLFEIVERNLSDLGRIEVH